MKKLITLTLVSASLFIISCGDDKEAGGDDNDSPKMTVCDCKTFQDKFLAEFDAGDVSANELNKKYRAEKEACYQLRTDMGKDKYDEEFSACE